MTAAFEADHFDGRTAARRSVRVEVDSGSLRVTGDGLAFEIPRGAASVLPRLGKTPVRIALPDGGLLVAGDFDAVNGALGVPAVRTLAHRLESHAGFVVASLVAVIAVAALAYWKGVPLVSREIAERIPPQVESELSKRSLAMVDNFLFRPSKVPARRIIQIQNDFASLARAGGLGDSVRVDFRTGGYLGPNAFTLPGGVVLVTDELMAILDDRQVAAVLAHELGHVHHRHTLRRVLDSSMYALFAMAVYGDATAAGAAAANLPNVLISTSYSRDFEREADRYGLELLKKTGRSPYDFSTALDELRNEMKDKMGNSDSGLKLGYLATHPDVDERIEAAERFK